MGKKSLRTRAVDQDSRMEKLLFSDFVQPCPWVDATCLACGNADVSECNETGAHGFSIRYQACADNDSIYEADDVGGRLETSPLA